MTAEAIRDQGQMESPPPPGTKRARRVRMIKRGIKLFFLIFALVVALLFFTAPLSQSLSPKLETPSLTILSAEGEAIARRGANIGDPVDVTQLPPHVGLAFVAIEDRRFYRHWGIDPRGIARALQKMHSLLARRCREQAHHRHVLSRLHEGEVERDRVAQAVCRRERSDDRVRGRTERRLRRHGRHALVGERGVDIA